MVIRLSAAKASEAVRRATMARGMVFRIVDGVVYTMVGGETTGGAGLACCPFATGGYIQEVVEKVR